MRNHHKTPCNQKRSGDILSTGHTGYRFSGRSRVHTVHEQAARHRAAFFISHAARLNPQRALAAFRASSRRCLAVICSCRALPPKD